METFSSQLKRYYDEAGPHLRAYFRRQPALANSADDLLQETFLRACRQAAQLQRAVSPRAYLFGIARHVGIDALRRQRPLEPLVDEIAFEPAATNDERLELMRVAIAALPNDHRETLLLKLQQELSYAEIAAVLQVPVGTVRSRLHHAMRRLQAVLNPVAESARSSASNPITHET